MSDDKSKPGGQDLKRISLSDEHEVRDWADKFGVSREELVIAVSQVGNEASGVEAHLNAYKSK